MDELKACPFCGNSPMRTSNHTILCQTCNREVLPEIWTSRPIEDKLQREADEWRKGFNEVAQFYHIECEKNKSLRHNLKKAIWKIEKSQREMKQFCPKIPLINGEPPNVIGGEDVGLRMALHILRSHNLIEEKNDR